MPKLKYAFAILAFILVISKSCDFKHCNSEIKVPVVKTYAYDSLKIPEFFIALISNHSSDFIKRYHSNIKSLSNNFKVDVLDSSNLKTILTLKILHELFTAQSASNGSTGKILNIPYFWHWTNPNPRHSIKLVEGSVLLSNVKPLDKFKKYNSYADIDRTPYLFLSDMTKPRPTYIADCCDTFYTFGWCSEREMAFVSLCGLLGISGKVIAEGNHSWSEFLVNLNLEESGQQYFVAKVDNTFNQLTWSEIKEENIENWHNLLGNSNLSNWYNSKAKSISELDSIGNTYFSNAAMNYIEISVVRYLENEI